MYITKATISLYFKCFDK